MTAGTEKPIIAASLLAADPACYGPEITDVADKIDWLHLDIMDGSFVPPITFGANIVAMAAKSCDLPLDTHLMISNPGQHIAAFAEAGCSIITIHREATPHLHRLLGQIRSTGTKAGVAINPGTPAESVFSVLDLCDLVLVMTVNPGWGGQSFIETCLYKITALRSECARRGLSVDIEVDGGITEQTAPRCIDAGATVLVAGTYIFKAADRAAAITSLRGRYNHAISHQNVANPKK